MDESVSELDRGRRQLLFWFIVAFLLWQVPTVALEALGRGWSGAGILAALGAAGAVAWLVMVYRLVRTVVKLQRRPEAQSALNDERVRALRCRAFGVGFIVLTAYLVLLRVAAFWMAVPAGVTVGVGIVLAVVAPVVVYLFMDRDGE